MDIETIKLLGGGSAQLILAAVCIGLAYVAWKLGTSLIQMFRDQLEAQKAMLQQKSEDSRLVAESLKDMKATMDLALAALKGRP
ncbi:hypothetical protein [Reyranella sp.]|uniref:hypothetical protein n=1 Tax=Reyranella sp. TaxID=1929291 RepID=UPI003C7BC980